MQLRPIAVTITLCKHPARGLTKPPAVSYVFLLERSHVPTCHVDVSYFYVSLIYGEYQYLANIHFCDIPHFTLHSALNFPHSQLSAFRFPQNTPSPFVYIDDDDDDDDEGICTERHKSSSDALPISQTGGPSNVERTPEGRELQFAERLVNCSR